MRLRETNLNRAEPRVNHTTILYSGLAHVSGRNRAARIIESGAARDGFPPNFPSIHPDPATSSGIRRDTPCSTMPTTAGHLGDLIRLNSVGPLRTQPMQQIGVAPPRRTGYPNTVLAPYHPFTPTTYQSWKREAELWISGEPGDIATQMLARSMQVLPFEGNKAAMIYMERKRR